LIAEPDRSVAADADERAAPLITATDEHGVGL